MSDLLCVAVVEPEDQLLEEIACGLLVEAFCRNDSVEEFPSRDKLKHQVDVALGLEHLVQLDNVLVVEQLHDGYLSLELFLHMLPLQLLLVNDFDGIVLRCFSIYPELDLRRLSEEVFLVWLWCSSEPTIYYANVMRL